MATEAISYLSDKKEIAALPAGARNDKKAVATQSASPALVPSRVFAGTTPGFLIALRFSEMTHGYVITFSVISRSIATRNLYVRLIRFLTYVRNDTLLACGGSERVTFRL